MDTILKAIGIFLFCVFVVAIAIAASAYILFALLGFLVIAFMAWAIGIPISIKNNGVKIGYIRWFKFYDVDDTTNQ